MNKQPKIGILCNSTLGIPSLQAMLSSKLVTAIGMPNIVHDATKDIRNVATSFQQEVTELTKQDLKIGLNNWIKKHQLDIVLVFTFPWKIAKETLALPKLGFINFHFGLLPQYRGADAIFWSIKNRATHGGISVHKMDTSFDTGALIHIEKIPLLPTDTYGMHNAKLANANVNVLQKTLPLLFSGAIKTSAQNGNDAAYYTKPTIKDIAIQWETMTAVEIVALINACNPWNKGAYTMLNGMPIRITEAIVTNTTDATTTNGTILDVSKEGILIKCSGSDAIMAQIITIEEGIYSANVYINQFEVKKGLIFKNLNI